MLDAPGSEKHLRIPERNDAAMRGRVPHPRGGLAADEDLRVSDQNNVRRPIVQQDTPLLELAALRDGVFQHADSRDFRLDNIAGFQKDGRLASGANAGGGAGRDHVARLQRDEGGDD